MGGDPATNYLETDAGKPRALPHVSYLAQTQKFIAVILKSPE